MQFIDALLWHVEAESERGLEACSELNAWVTWVGFAVIMSEPFASLLGAIVRDRFDEDKFAPKFGRAANNVYFTWRRIAIWGGLYALVFIGAPTVANHVFGVGSGCSEHDPRYTGHEYCSALSSEGWMQLGLGRDLSYRPACWRQYMVTGDFDEQIPLALRFAFLLGIVVPFVWPATNPRGSGMLHAGVIVCTWLYGYTTDSHANLWCWANVAQALVVGADPLLFPRRRQTLEPPLKRSKRHELTRDNFLSSKVPAEPLDAIVVGSGVGGLMCAALMAKSGRRVLVLEQHYRAGGATHAFDELGQTFDSGIHYVGAKGMLEAVIGLAGDRPVRFAPMGAESDGFVYDVVALGDNSDADVYRFPRGRAELCAALQASFPHERDAIRAYLYEDLPRASRAARCFVLWKLLDGRVRWLSDWLLARVQRVARQTMAQAINARFADKRLRALLAGGQMIDHNAAPDQCSAFVGQMMTEYYVDGGFYPHGGSTQIAESMIETIERAGGRVLVRAEVDEIVCRDGAAIGVRLKRQPDAVIEAPLVVSDAGIVNTYDRLLSADALASVGLRSWSDAGGRRRVASSNAHLTAFVSLRGTSAANGLSSANMHSFLGAERFGYDLSALQRAFHADPVASARAGLITITSPSAKDPQFELDFPGTSNALLLADVDDRLYERFASERYKKRSPDYERFKKQLEDVFLERLYHHFPKTRGNVTMCEIGTPATTAHFLSADRGGSYGLEWTPAHFEIDNLEPWQRARTPIAQLYLSGEGSLFGGLLGASISAYVTAFKIMGPVDFLRALLCEQDSIERC
jgi:phytoene dehydrogenase-like protein